MKGVILAGGLGTRLAPCTNVTNKHLLPVYNKPMIYYPIQTLVDAGVTDILIICGPEFSGSFLNLLRSGKEFGVNFSFEVQDEPLGIADGMRLAEEFVDGEKFAAILGDNIYEDNFRPVFEKFMNSDEGAHLFLKEVQDAERFGVAEVSGDKIVGIEEKPSQPKSNLAVTGLYLLDANAFEHIRNLKPSERGQLEITDVNNKYVESSNLGYTKLTGFWSDAGTHESLLQASILIRDKLAQ